MAKTTKGRVITSANPTDCLRTASKIFEKHLADGAASPLNNLEEGLSWSETGPTITTCLSYHENAEKYKGLMEQAYRQRDNLLEEINSLTIYSKNRLKGMYQKNPKKLAEWGFQVNSTPPVKKKKTAA